MNSRNPSNCFIRTYSKTQPHKRPNVSTEVICLEDDEKDVCVDHNLILKPENKITTISSPETIESDSVHISSDNESISSRKCDCLSSRESTNINVSTVNNSDDFNSAQGSHKISNNNKQKSNLLQSVLLNIEQIQPSMTSIDRVLNWKLDDDRNEVIVIEPEYNLRSSNSKTNVSMSGVDSTKVNHCSRNPVSCKRRTLKASNSNNKIQVIDSSSSTNSDINEGCCTQTNKITSQIFSKNKMNNSNTDNDSLSNLNLHYSDSSDDFFRKYKTSREIDKIYETQKDVNNEKISSILIRYNYTDNAVNKTYDECFKKPLPFTFKKMNKYENSKINIDDGILSNVQKAEELDNTLSLSNEIPVAEICIEDQNKCTTRILRSGLENTKTPEKTNLEERIGPPLSSSLPPLESSELDKTLGSRCSGLITILENENSSTVKDSPNKILSPVSIDLSIDNSEESQSSEATSYTFEKFAYLADTETLSEISNKYSSNVIDLHCAKECDPFPNQSNRLHDRLLEMKNANKKLKYLKYKTIRQQKNRERALRKQIVTIRKRLIHSLSRQKTLKNKIHSPSTVLKSEIDFQIKKVTPEQQIEDIVSSIDEFDPSFSKAMLYKRISTDSALGDSIINSPSSKINETTNFMSNPLSQSDGKILCAYYVDKFETIAIIQEYLISFWKFKSLFLLLGTSQSWEPFGSVVRTNDDVEVATQNQNKFTICDDNIFYMELRGQISFPNEFREVYLTSLYVKLYFKNIKNNELNIKLISLDTIRALPTEVCFTVLKHSRYFIVGWTEQEIEKNKSGVCKYCLTPSMDTLASIREFPLVKHKIYTLQQIEDEKLIGIGYSEISIWNHNTGDLLTSIDLKISLGRNILSYLLHNNNDSKYIILLQNIDSNIKIIFIKLNDIYAWKIINSIQIPSKLDVPESSTRLSDIVIIKFKNNRTLLISLNKFHATFMNVKYNESEKFSYENLIFPYENHITIIGEYSMTVKSITEYLLDVKIV